MEMRRKQSHTAHPGNKTLGTKTKRMVDAHRALLSFRVSVARKSPTQLLRRCTLLSRAVFCILAGVVRAYRGDTSLLPGDPNQLNLPSERAGKENKRKRKLALDAKTAGDRLG
jgi:hypothetical protein